MAQFRAIYLSFDDGLIEKVVEISETLKQKGYLFTVRYHEQASWVQLYVEKPENVPYYTQDVSKIFPQKQVIGLASYTVSDSVIFCKYKDGELWSVCYSLDSSESFNGIRLKETLNLGSPRFLGI